MKSLGGTPHTVVSKYGRKQGPFIFYDGQYRTVYETAKLVDMSPRTLRNRLAKGMTLTAALTTPVGVLKSRTGPSPKLYEFRGEKLVLKEIAAILGVSKSTAYSRLIGDRVAEVHELKDPHRELPSNAHHVTIGGETRTVVAWARLKGVSPRTIYHRIHRKGWTPREAILTPIRTAQRYLFRGERLTVKEVAHLTGWSETKVHYRIRGDEILEARTNRRSKYMLTFNGKTMTLGQWAEETGIGYGTLRERLVSFHWPVARALTEPVMNAAQRRSNCKTNTGGGYSQSFAPSVGTGVGTPARDLQSEKLVG